MGAAPAKGFGNGGTRPSNGTGEVMSKPETPVDEVAGEAGSAPLSGLAQTKGLVGNGLKGGTGAGAGEIRV